MNPKKKLLLAMLGYAALVILAVGVARSGLGLSQNVLLLLALLPLLPGIFVVLAVRDHIIAQDELERTIQVEALALAFGGTFLALLAGSLVTIAGLPQPGAGLTLPIMAILWITGQGLARRRYQ